MNQETNMIKSGRSSRSERAAKLRLTAYMMGYCFGRSSVGPLAAKSADHGAHMREHWEHLQKMGDVPALPNADSPASAPKN